MTSSPKVAVVTGSTSGIGFGIAQAFAQAGYHILLNGLGHHQEAVSKIQQVGTKVAYSEADLSTREGCYALIDHALQEFGGVHVLVNNAGIQHVSPIESFAPEKWEKIIALNLSAAFYTMQRALPTLRQNGWGRIINIASAHGLVASPQKSAYVAAKHGLVGLTKTVALETAGSGITCNAICPGWVFTPLVAKQVEERAQQKGLTFEESKKDLLLEKQPSGEFATPEELGALAVFLASDGAAQITGTPISMDGGWTAR